MREFVFDEISYLAKLCERQVTIRCGKIFAQFCKKPRTYDDLLRFQSRVMDPIHIAILMRSINPFFVHSSHVLTLAY